MADHINSFFASLTENFPEIRSEWMSSEILDPLPEITYESVENKLKHLNENKSPGPQTRLLS